MAHSFDFILCQLPSANCFYILSIKLLLKFKPFNYLQYCPFIVK